MMPHSSGRLWATIFLFGFFLANVLRIVHAEVDTNAEVGQEEQYANAATGEEGQVALQMPHEDDEQENIAALVNQAQQILNEVERANIRNLRRGGQQSYFSTGLGYLQKFLDFIFIAGVPSQEEPIDGAPRGQPVQMSKPLTKAVELLEEAATKGNPDAQFLLAEMNFYGNYTYPRHYPTAFKWYKELATTTGNRSAQNMVGFLYGTGFGGAVERDQSKSLLYHTFAALSGDTRSEMTVAFRHHHGIGTPRNCEEAAFFYKRVADKAMTYYLSGPPGGMHLTRNNYRQADEYGGVYGEGASASSAGSNRRKPSQTDKSTSIEDVLELLELMAGKGDLKACLQLGQVYYDPPRGVKRNLKKAKAYFHLVARKYWNEKGSTISNAPDSVLEHAPKAAGYLGRMYLRGEATPESPEKARKWFKRGVQFGDAQSQHGMGYLYEHGLGGLEKSVEKASQFYKAAAELDYGPAQVSIGKMFQAQGEVGVANKWFELATRHGILDAYYQLAEINNNNEHGREKSCGMATLYYKIVAERVEPLQSPLAWANQAYENGDRESALIGYTMAAEQGYESGQANVAYILDEEKSRLEFSFLNRRRNDSREQELALIYWTRSAKQANIDSLVKMGDYYLVGIGTDEDHEKAATCYQAAAEFQQSAQALWNLGWMHENGIGVEQDYHLAKRFYDQALESNTEAYLPVTLSVLKLRARSFWNTMTGGTINGIGKDPEPVNEWSFREWLTKWFADDPHDHRHGAEHGGRDSEDTHMPDLGGNEYYEEDFDDDSLENILIIAGFIAVGILLYVRAQRAQRQQQEQQRQQQGQQGQNQPPVAAAPGDNADLQNQFGWMMPPPLG